MTTTLPGPTMPNWWRRLGACRRFIHEQLAFLDFGFFIAETEASPKRLRSRIADLQAPTARSTAAFAKNLYREYLTSHRPEGAIQPHHRVPLDWHARRLAGGVESVDLLASHFLPSTLEKGRNDRQVSSTSSWPTCTCRCWSRPALVGNACDRRAWWTGCLPCTRRFRPCLRRTGSRCCAGLRRAPGGDARRLWRVRPAGLRPHARAWASAGKTAQEVVLFGHEGSRRHQPARLAVWAAWPPFCCWMSVKLQECDCAALCLQCLRPCDGASDAGAPLQCGRG